MDDSLDLAAWPNAILDVLFENPPDEAPPRLTFTIEYDASRYRSERDSQRRALDDAAVYEAIAVEFRAADAAVSMQSSIDGHQVHSLDATRFAAFADGVARYIRELLDGTRPEPPAGLTLHVPVEATNRDDLFALEVTVSASSSQRQAASKIPPRAPVQFAKAFEIAYAGADTYFKVLAEATFRENLDAQHIWLMRLRRQDADSRSGIAFATDGTARYYAPVPLSHVPLSRSDVPIVHFDPAAGIDWEKPQKLAFSQVDIELWARSALSAIDAFVATDGVQNDKRRELAQVKSELAARIAATLSPILESGEAPPSDAALQNAVKTMRQQIFLKAQNAYETTAICQFETTVDSAYEDVPGSGIYAPRFIGRLQSSAACRFSTVISILARGKGFVTSALSLTRPDLQTYLPLDLSFQIENVVYAGARAALWFVIPFDNTTGMAPQTTIGAVQVPTVLRELAQPPMLAAQRATPLEAEPKTVDQAKRWTYDMTFESNVTEHDTICVSVSFNIGEDQNDTDSALARASHDLDLFDHLARVAAVWPAMAAELSQASVSRIDALTADFLRLVKPLPAAWAAWRLPQPGVLQARHKARIDVTLRERNLDGFLVLTQTLQVNDAHAAAVPQPQIRLVDGSSTYTARASSAPDEFYYADDEGKRLTYEAARSLTRRQITFAGLNIVALQNASSSVHITRNEMFQQFAYSGVPVAFASAAVPRQVFHERFDVSLLSTPQQQTLATHLERLLLSFYEDIEPASALTIRFDAAYVQPTADGLPEAIVPVFGGLQLRADRKRASEVAVEAAAIILDWFAENRPPGGHFRFALTLFTTLGETLVPILELSALDLAPARVSDLPGS